MLRSKQQQTVQKVALNVLSKKCSEVKNEAAEKRLKTAVAAISMFDPEIV